MNPVQLIDAVIEQLVKLIPGPLHNKLKAATGVGLVLIAIQGALQALDGAHLPGLAGTAITLALSILAGFRKAA
jgi:hypothetical protein